MNDKALKLVVAVLILISIGLTLKVFILQRTTLQKSVSVPPTTAVNLPQSASEKTIVEFTHANYRIVKMFESEDYPYVIYIATEKSDTGCGEGGHSRCKDDTVCGSIYTTPTCFFFQEPKSEYGVDSQSKYIGSLVKQGAILFNTLKIKDKSLFFTTSDGEGMYMSGADWKLDLSTGIFSQLRKWQNNAEM